MVLNMIHAVAVIAVAFGAVAEFQIGVLGISPSADSAFVAIQRNSCFLLIIFGPVCVGTLSCMPFAGRFHKVRQDLQNVGTKEQEVVEQGKKWEEVQTDHVDDGDCKVEPSQPFHLQGDNKEQDCWMASPTQCI